MDDDRFDHLVSLRRDLHRHPEPAWREFYTTVRIVEELDRVGDAGQRPIAGQAESDAVDRTYVGPELIAPEERLAVPDDGELSDWFDRARETGASTDLLEQLRGGNTGVLAVLESGPGPTVALRVDIDGLPREESTDPDHLPVAEGFRSETGAMHACGHDAHATIGVGVLEAVAESEFDGTLKVLFQPAEEVIGGARPVAESGLLDDVDYFLAVHVGLDHPTGEVVAGIEDFLAVSQFRAEFSGEPAHAGGHPAQGRNAVQAMAAAVQNLYAIPRNEAGATRVNAGVVEGGTATNIVPEYASVEGEVRGETTELMEYMRERADRVLDHAAAMHDCAVDVTTTGEAPSAENDAEIVDLAYDLAGGIDGVTSRLRTDPLGGSEDATFLMRRVQDHGGKAAYVAVGTDHPGGHHTATFDVDEESIAIGVDWLADVVTALAENRP